jgi:hypothetical protein
MKTTRPGNAPGSINEIDKRIFELKDRIAFESDRETKEIVVSAVMELEEYRKLLRNKSGKPDTDAMEESVHNGNMSFIKATGSAGETFRAMG